MFISATSPLSRTSLVPKIMLSRLEFILKYWLTFLSPFSSDFFHLYSHPVRYLIVSLSVRSCSRSPFFFFQTVLVSPFKSFASLYLTPPPPIDFLSSGFLKKKYLSIVLPDLILHCLRCLLVNFFLLLTLSSSISYWKYLWSYAFVLSPDSAGRLWCLLCSGHGQQVYQPQAQVC